MKKTHTLFIGLGLLAALTIQAPVQAQNTTASNPQQYRGYPSFDDGRDLRSSFAAPPKGYGNVPFLWFNGDTLKRDRMSHLLDVLGKSATDGFSVSYIHRNPTVDSTLHKDGYGMFGHTDPGEPPVFSEAWWEFWNWFSEACAEHDMGAGLDDYTVGWIGNGYYPDETFRNAKYADYQGKLHIDRHEVKGGESISLDLPDHTLCAVAYAAPTPGAPNDLTNRIQDRHLDWQAPSATDQTLYIVYTSPDYLLHPDSGKDLVQNYFGRFEQKMSAEALRGMNYFFQDELSYPLTILSWSEDMPEEFLARKGYNIRPYLPALAYEIGTMTTKVRLDYCDVVMTLAEERYFKPVFDWNYERGLIYGCDNLGRGLQPLAYLDYFRATGWFTAPGNDAPARGSSFMQTKRSSSIAHMYNRPRTWLEAFHSMGWGSKAEWLTEQIDHHIIAGGNLVCMHGLYYSTHGGWWEWAPPCFHFRMPYWEHMKKWLEYTERLSYLTSQGDHVCDILTLYPTETLQAFFPTQTGNYDFSYAQLMSDNGLDYDFTDTRSLLEANIHDQQLTIGREHYRVLILNNIKAISFDALQKIRNFYRAGGIVIGIGELPEASNRIGSNDPEVNGIIREIFGITADQTADVAAKAQSNPMGGKGYYIGSSRGLIALLKRCVIPDFNPGDKGGKVLHRRIKDQDVYMVMNVKPGTECFFRAKGKVELWNATTGTFHAQEVTRVTSNGTYLRLQAPENRSSLIVFSPGEPTFATTDTVTIVPETRVPVEGEWEVEAKPTLDNTWGDFRLPASAGMIGIEARSVRYAPLRGLPKTWMKPEFNDSTWRQGTYGFGEKMEMLADSSELSTDQLVAQVLDGARNDWQPYEFSWQYGVEGQPGSQGYHGLKGRVDNHFLILDRGTRMIFRTQVLAPEHGVYHLSVEGVSPERILIDRESVESPNIELRKGWHDLIAVFDSTSTLPLKMAQHIYLDPRPRSSVVLLPAADSSLQEITPYSDIIAMKWFRSSHLPYGVRGGSERTAYRFETAPGLESLTLDLAGQLEKAWVNGVPIDAKRQIRQTEPGCYEITLPNKVSHVSVVALQILPEDGADGAAVFRAPIQLHCGTGWMEAGDWSKVGALRYYSGGMYYRKVVSLTAEQIAQGVRLDLGSVSATCEIKVNGRDAGTYIYSPFQAEITSLLHPGENQIEVLVYSTLANHYQTIPTPYKGDPEAGLIGPVELILGGGPSQP